MTVQTSKKFYAGKGLTNTGGLDLDLKDSAADFEMLRDAYIALLQKLDSDAVGGANYEALLTPDELKTTQG